jgi:hypothetical protein
MSTEERQPKPGDMVVLVDLPPGFLDDLPLKEQFTISEMVGKSIKFCGITSGIFRNSRWERAELEFSDKKRNEPYLICRSELHSASQIGHSRNVRGEGGDGLDALEPGEIVRTLPHAKRQEIRGIGTAPDPHRCILGDEA